MHDGTADARDAGGDHSQRDRARSFGWRLVAVALILVPAWIASAAPSSIAVQREQVRQLEAQVFEIDGRAGEARASYAVARDRLVALKQRIGRNRTELRKTRDNQRIAQTRLADRLSAMYRTPDPSVVDAFVSTGSFTEALTSWSVFKRVADQDFTTVRGIRRTKDRIKALQAELMADRRKARAQFNERSARFRELSAVQAERRQLLSGARAQLAVFIQAEQQRQAAAAQARAAAAARVAARTRPAASGAAASAPVPAGNGATTAVLERIAQCESGGSVSAVSPSGQYRGKYQFDPGTWKNLGGSGSDPAKAPEGEQDRVAAKLYRASGATPWPICGRFAR